MMKQRFRSSDGDMIITNRVRQSWPLLALHSNTFDCFDVNCLWCRVWFIIRGLYNKQTAMAIMVEGPGGSVTFAETHTETLS